MEMDYKKKYDRHMPVCLECGDKIRYGRTDKKFCCDDCRTRHFNEMAKIGRAFRRRMINVLTRNYGLLEGLYKAGVESVDIMDMIAMGFIPSAVTSYHKVGKHDEYSCFDIKYIMTSTRIYAISKIQNFD